MTLLYLTEFTAPAVPRSGASLMPETFFGMTMTTPWFYSLLYNGFYMVIDAVLCLLVFGLLFAPMKTWLLGEDLR